MGATTRNVDFSNVKDRGAFNRNRIPAGDYLAKVVKVEDYKKEGDSTPQYLFTIKLVKRPSSVFPYYCKLQDNQLWKLRNILIAAGKAVPKKKSKVDPNTIVGKFIGVTIDDADDYNNREQSEISGVFPSSELDDDSVEDDDTEGESEDEEEEAEDTLDDDEDETEEEADEEVEDEEEEEEEAGDEYDAMDRIALRKALMKVGVDKTSKSQSDDDLRNLLREKATEAAKPKAKAEKPARKAKPKASDISDDELEELDIDDL